MAVVNKSLTIEIPGFQAYLAMAPGKVERYLSRHGSLHAWRPLPLGVPVMAPQMCWANALELSLARGWQCVMGLAMTEGMPIPMHHAWVLDEEGHVVDPTWAGVRGSPTFTDYNARVHRTYLGIPVAPDLAHRYLMSTDALTPLDMFVRWLEKHEKLSPACASR